MNSVRVMFDKGAMVVAAVFAFAAISTGAHCTKPGPPPPTDGTDCLAACERLGPKGLACPAFGPTPGAIGSDGVAHPVPCETWLCQSKGVKTGCLVKANTCDEANTFQTHGCMP
jgi:hypothetical protein